MDSYQVTKPGWYWAERIDLCKKPAPVQIVQDTKDNSLLVITPGGWSHMSYFRFLSGPLTPPNATGDGDDTTLLDQLRAANAILKHERDRAIIERAELLRIANECGPARKDAEYRLAEAQREIERLAAELDRMKHPVPPAAAPLGQPDPPQSSPTMSNGYSVLDAETREHLLYHLRLVRRAIDRLEMDVTINVSKSKEKISQ